MKIGRKEILLLVGVCLALLPIILYRDFTPSNELRYLSIADEAMHNGTFFAFTNHGLPYADKPPLYLWIVMLCRWITGGHYMWLLSLFSLLPAVGIVLIMNRWVAREMAPGPSAGINGDGSSVCDAGSIGLLSGLMLLTCAYFIGAAVTLRMDMLMSFFIVLALREFWRMWTFRRSGSAGDMKSERQYRRARWLFPVWLFLALFTKGPYGILIPLFGTAVFLVVSGDLRHFFRYWDWRTWLVLIVLCALWFGAVYMEGGTDYLNNLLFHQTVGRAVNSFHHKAPIYYYAICIWYSIAPWSIIVVGILVAALCRRFSKRRAAAPAEGNAGAVLPDANAGGYKMLRRYFVTVGVTTLVALSCFSSKLPVYLLPAFPFLIYGAVMYYPDFRDSLLCRIALTVPSAIFAIVLPGIFVAVFAAGVSFLNLWEIYLACAILSLSGIYALCILWRKKAVVDATKVIAVGMLLTIFVCGWAVPELNPQIGYRALCDEAMQLSHEYGISEFHTWHVHRPENMDVYLHKDVTIIPNEEEPSTADPCLLMIHERYIDRYQGFRVETVGPYAVVVCPGESPSI